MRIPRASTSFGPGAESDIHAPPGGCPEREGWGHLSLSWLCGSSPGEPPRGGERLRAACATGSHHRLCPQLGEAQAACEAAKKVSQQLRRRCRRLVCELEDARVLAESQQSRSHELEKRQKK